MIERTDTIVALEYRFWEAMLDKDGRAAAALMAGSTISTGPHGISRFDPATFRQMTAKGDWTLESYELTDVFVLFPAEDIAVIGYKVHQTGTIGTERMDMVCADASTWVRDHGTWKCALHSETPLRNTS